MKFYIVDMFVSEMIMYKVHEKKIFLKDMHNNLCTASIQLYNLKMSQV